MKMIRFGAICVLLAFGALSALARETVSLDGVWRFALDLEKIGETQEWFAPNFELPNNPPDGSAPEADGTIRVPGIWDNQGYGSATDKLKHHFVGQGWYKRSFDLPAEWQGESVILTLGGISRYAKVWVNGELAGPELVGQVASFSLDITPLVKFGGSNDITIRVDSDQRWEIDAILGASSLNDYMEIEWGGLWGHVTLQTRPAERLDDLYLKTNLADSTCTAQASVSGVQTADAVKIEIFDAEQKLVAEKREKIGAVKDAETIAVSARIENPNLWTPDTPYLYTVKLSLLAGENMLDTLESRYGMREFSTEGTKLLLNGKPLFLIGYGDDHIYPYEFSMPTDKGMYLARLKIIKSFGFNHVRHHSTILPHEYYEACDEIGIMPTGEFPIGYPQQLPGNDIWKKNVPEGTPTEPALETYRERFAQVVKEYRNHPCILTWVMGNELWQGMSINKDFQKIAKTLDPQRFFCDSDGDWASYFEQGKDRDTLALYFVLFNEWISPMTLEKFTMTGFKKPVISHEAGNYITFSRPDQIALFDNGLFEGNPALAGRAEADKKKPLASDFVPFWMTDGAAKLKELGLDNETESWAKATEEMYYIHHKYNVEGARLNPEISGYHWWLIQDYWTTSNGLVDLFFRPKSIAPERVRIFNAPLVLLQKGLDLTCRSGDELKLDLLISNFTDAQITGTLERTAKLKKSDFCATLSEPVENVAPGELKTICTVTEKLPEVEEPQELEICVTLKNADGEIVKTNAWKTWVYPKAQSGNVVGKTVYASDDVRELFPEAGLEPIPADGALAADAVYVMSFMEPRLADALEAGAGVVLLGESQNFPCQSIQYQQTWWKGGDSDSTNHVGTFVYDTPLMRKLETENWCQPHWYYLLNGAVKYYLDPLPARPVVHLRALPSLVRVQDTAVIFDVAVGKGTLVVSGLNHTGAKGRPENAAAVIAMIERAASGEKPQVSWPKSAVEPNESVPDGTILGYRRVLPSKYEEARWKSFRGDNARSLTCRQNSKGNFVMWQTAQVPENAETVTFVFAAGLGFSGQPATDGFSLEVNDQAVLNFDLPPAEGDSCEWKSADGSATLAFDIRRREPQDAFGVFRLTVQKSLLTGKNTGERLTVRSLGEGSQRWFGLNPIVDLK